jgi:hypothetical protein
VLIRVKNIILFLALSLLLLQSFVPHQHHDSSEECIEEITQENTNLLSLVAQAFHLDLGDDHHFKDFEGKNHQFNTHLLASDSVVVS